MTQSKKKLIVDIVKRAIGESKNICFEGLIIYGIDLVESSKHNAQAEIIFTVKIDTKRELLIMDDSKILELYEKCKQYLEKNK